MNHSSDYNDILDIKNYQNIWVKKKLTLKKRDIYGVGAIILKFSKKTTNKIVWTMIFLIKWLIMIVVFKSQIQLCVLKILKWSPININRTQPKRD